jgi:hypothetical protein
MCCGGKTSSRTSFMSCTCRMMANNACGRRDAAIGGKLSYVVLGVE